MGHSCRFQVYCRPRHALNACRLQIARWKVPGGYIPWQQGFFIVLSRTEFKLFRRFAFLTALMASSGRRRKKSSRVTSLPVTPAVRASPPINRTWFLAMAREKFSSGTGRTGDSTRDSEPMTRLWSIASGCHTRPRNWSLAHGMEQLNFGIKTYQNWFRIITLRFTWIKVNCPKSRT